MLLGPGFGRAPAGRAREGAVFLIREPVLAVVVIVAFLSLLFMTTSAPAEVFFAKDFLHAGDTGYGLLVAVWTFGMAIGALVLARRVAAATLASGALIAVSSAVSPTASRTCSSGH